MSGLSGKQATAFCRLFLDIHSSAGTRGFLPTAKSLFNSCGTKGVCAAAMCRERLHQVPYAMLSCLLADGSGSSSSTMQKASFQKPTIFLAPE